MSHCSCCLKELYCTACEASRNDLPVEDTHIVQSFRLSSLPPIPHAKRKLKLKNFPNENKLD